jgi:hypothetical protein
LQNLCEPKKFDQEVSGKSLERYLYKKVLKSNDNGWIDRKTNLRNKADDIFLNISNDMLK